jgi:hypothetical protein
MPEIASHPYNCPRCGTPLFTEVDGRVIVHSRYADGAGPLSGQPHDMVRCEGSWEPVPE